MKKVIVEMHNSIDQKIYEAGDISYYYEQSSNDYIISWNNNKNVVNIPRGNVTCIEYVNNDNKYNQKIIKLKIHVTDLFDRETCHWTDSFYITNNCIIITGNDLSIEFKEDGSYLFRDNEKGLAGLFTKENVKYIESYTKVEFINNNEDSIFISNIKKSYSYY